MQANQKDRYSLFVDKLNVQGAGSSISVDLGEASNLGYGCPAFAIVLRFNRLG